MFSSLDLELTLDQKYLFICYRDMIATGCEDKCVRVFYVAASTDLPLKVFSGKQQFLIDTN